MNNKHLDDVKNIIEKEFSGLTCHIVDRNNEKDEYNIFDDVKQQSIESWKEKYVMELQKLKNNSEEHVDNWRVLKVLEAYKLGFCNKNQMTKEVMRIYGPWDCISRSIKYRMVEATLHCHICDFWDQCKEKCSETIPEWKDFSALTLEI